MALDTQRDGAPIQRRAEDAPDSPRAADAHSRPQATYVPSGQAERPRHAAVIWNAVYLLTALLAGAGLVYALASHALVGAPSTAAGSHGAAARVPTQPRWEGLPPGGTWKPTGFTAWTNALLADPRQPGFLAAGTTDGVWVSADSGTTWRRAGSGLRGASILALSRATDGTLVAGGADSAVYMGTVDRERGWRWQRISPRFGSDHPIFAVAVSPDARRTVLAGTFGALYRGVRSGHGWTWRPVVHTGDAAIAAIQWAPWATGLAFADVWEARPPVLASHDGGLTWQPDVAGLPATLPAQALLPLATHPPRLVLSTMGGGVWQRAADGRWRDVSAGLPAHHAMPLVVSAGSPAVLYAGTMGFGVYAQQGGQPWRRLGRGLNGGAYTVLALALTSGPHPTLLAGTARGIFRYVPPR